MDTTIYYFSGTGNSQATAEKLAVKLGNCILEPIAECVKKGRYVAQTSKVGFVFPLYYYGMPLIVEQFLESLDLKRAEYIFFVETRGGVWSPECICSDFKRILSKKGKELSAGFKIIMPNNFIKRGYKLNSPKVVEEKLGKAQSRISEIARKIAAKEKHIEKDILLLSGVARLVYNSWKQKVYESDKDFSVEQSCNSCGICEKVCPVDNIILVDGKPQWQHKCQECLACVHYCPSASIQCGQKEDKTLRYNHPEISVKEISVKLRGSSQGTGLH